MITQRFKEIDKRSIPVIVNFDLARRLCDEDTGGAAEDLDVDLMRWQ
jgi:hypothetical protein